MDNNLEQQKKTAQENLLQLLPPECGHLYMVGKENGIKQPHYIWLENGELHLRCIYFTANGTQIASYSPTFGEECTREIYKLLKKHFDNDGAKKCEHFVSKELLDKDVRDVDHFRTLCANSLYYNGDIHTVRDLVRSSRNHLMKIRNFGKLCMMDVEEFFKMNNLHFGMEV